MSKRVAQRRKRVGHAVVKALRERRALMGLSMLAVAERAGLSQQMVSYVERGLRNPSLETLLRLADALELRLSDLLRGAEDEAGDRG